MSAEAEEDDGRKPLADFLDEYADYLDAPDHAELVAELAEAVTARTHALRKAVRQARESQK